MSDGKRYIAVDLGAESGRVMMATLVSQKISLREMHRFVNGPIEKDGELYWDFDRIIHEIKLGIKKTILAEKEVQSIGVDTWGVDFGLIDSNGRLLENPYHYRDNRTNGIMEQAFKIMPKEKIYSNTGIQLMQLNSLFQLIAYKKSKPEVLKQASKLLFMPNLIMYMLTGDISAEYTIASTSQIMDMRTGRWSDEIIKNFNLPECVLPPIIQPGSKLGILNKALADEIGCDRIPVIAVGCHDTASAVAAVPAEDGKSWAYLSSGTWSLLGAEIPKPVINEKSFEFSFTNEGGVNNTIRFLKNIMGLWLIQQCRRQWVQERYELDYSQIIDMAADAEPFSAHLDVELPDFFSMGNMPDKVNNFLKSTGQASIEDKGRLARIILEGLAVKYSEVLDKLQYLIGRRIEVLHIVGGGCQNEILNQFTSDATGKKVVAGPVEATVLGNILVQAMATGEINSISQGRKIVSQSFQFKEYFPENTDEWYRYIKNSKFG